MDHSSYQQTRASPALVYVYLPMLATLSIYKLRSDQQIALLKAKLTMDHSSHKQTRAMPATVYVYLPMLATLSV